MTVLRLWRPGRYGVGKELFVAITAPCAYEVTAECPRGHGNFPAPTTALQVTSQEYAEWDTTRKAQEQRRKSEG